MSRRVQNVDDILALLDEESDVDELDPDVAESFRRDLEAFDRMVEYEESYVPPPKPDKTVAIREEPDSLIGSDGSKLDNYIKNEQNVETRTLDEILGEPDPGEWSMAQFDTPKGGTVTDVMPVGTKRSWYNFNRYTKGKYRAFEGEFGIGDDFDLESDTESELTESELTELL